MARIASVFPDRACEFQLDYEVPPHLLSAVGAGSRVRVPLRGREVAGTVLDLRDETPAMPLKAVASVIGDRPLLSPKLLALANWISDYYCCPLDVALSSVLPQAVRSGEVAEKRLLHARLAREVAPADLERLAARAPRQADALRALMRAEGPVAVSTLATSSGAGQQAIRALARDGLVTLETLPVGRDPHASERFLPTADLEPNPAQRLALEAAVRAIENPSAAKPILLFGVTGSGKTEVYLQAIRAALDRGRTALVLVPEISLTPQTVERFKARFAAIQGEIAVSHSHLSAGERRDEWYKIRRGGARVVIGARSAVFAPLDRLGILIVDEEHETSYKQEDAPRYHARDIAVLRGRLEPAAVILGTATPSLESWHNAQTGKYELLTLPERVDDRRMPVFRVQDMRRGSRDGDPIVSPALARAVEGRLALGQQVILFLNRRGFSTSMQCTACGEVCTCPNCSVALTYHRDAGSLACHICGFTRRAPKICPACSDPGIRHSGVGTQKVEDTFRRLFPKARLARMDADAMSRKDAYRETLGAFRRGEIDLLIGTQMIAKGLDFPNVTLVGIINADIGLHVPDFRAGERTFQLLTQVAGRAGRGEMEGEVIVQTFTPFSPSIQFAKRHDFEGFAEQELEFRERFGFPPFSRMVLVTVRSASPERAEFCAATLARKLREELPAGCVCGESAPAPLAKARGQHRFQISLRGPSARAIARHVRATVDALPMPEDVFTAVDVDPVNLL